MRFLRWLFGGRSSLYVQGLHATPEPVMDTAALRLALSKQNYQPTFRIRRTR